MKNLRGVIIFDIIMVILIIFLYSPLHLGLSPMSPNIFAAALSIILGVAIIYGLVKVNGKALLEERARRRFAAPDIEADASDLRRLFSDYEKRSVVGQYARQAIHELDTVDHRHAAISRTIEEKFMKGSITWQKFIAVPDSAKEVITQNCDLLLRRIRNFDVNTYNRLNRRGILISTRRNPASSALQDEQRALLEGNLAEMKAIVDANENILIELDKFAIALSQPALDENAESSSRMLEEINTLIEQTKYYQ